METSSADYWQLYYFTAAEYIPQTSSGRLVTGSNKGIGLAIVKELCAKFDGAVYLTSRDENRGNAAVEELKKLGLNTRFHQLDINDEASVIRLRDYLKATYGGLDVLVNNAAILLELGQVNNLLFAEKASKTLETNFFHTMRASDILFPILKPHARVVNVSSSAGHLSQINGKEPAATELKEKLAAAALTREKLCNLLRGFIEAAKTETHTDLGWPPNNEETMICCYIVSKVGLSALTRIQQREFDTDARPDLIVNAVHPGYVFTDMTNNTGVLTVEQGAAAPSWLATLPPNVVGPKGAYIWHDKTAVDWVNGPMPGPY